MTVMKDAPGATTQKRRSGIGKVLFFILKALYLTPFIALGLWLLSLVYLQGVDVKKPFTTARRPRWMTS